MFVPLCMDTRPAEAGVSEPLHNETELVSVAAALAAASPQGTTAHTSPSDAPYRVMAEAGAAGGQQDNLVCGVNNLTCQ